MNSVLNLVVYSVVEFGWRLKATNFLPTKKSPCHQPPPPPLHLSKRQIFFQTKSPCNSLQPPPLTSIKATNFHQNKISLPTAAATAATFIKATNFLPNKISLQQPPATAAPSHQCYKFSSKNNHLAARTFRIQFKSAICFTSLISSKSFLRRSLLPSDFMILDVYLIMFR